MMKIVQLPGTDRRLYELVAPLVMNPAVLKQNYNYPFRTSEDFVWFIALEDNAVVGFMPVEKKKGELVINNYYIKGNDEGILKQLLEEAINKSGEEANLARSYSSNTARCSRSSVLRTRRSGPVT